MTVEELTDEISAIDAIYPNSVTSIGPQIYTFKIPNHESVSIQLNFPLTYPEEIPQLLQIIVEKTTQSSSFTDTSYLEKHVDEILQRVFVPEQVVLFELLTELQEFFDQYVEEHQQVMVEETEVMPVNEKQPKQVTPIELHIDVLQELKDPTIDWIQSDPIVDRGSTFIAYVRQVNCLQEAQEYLDNLLTDKKIAKATHNISSWRIKMENGVTFQDCDDDGETAAGGRLLHLLQVCINNDLLLLLLLISS